MRYRYANTWDPPMPVLKIRLGYPGNELSLRPYTAIVDTGADGTILPLQLIDLMHAPMVDQVRVRSQWRGWQRMPMFTVDVGVGSLCLSAIEVVGNEQDEEIILGRNVINELCLLLDGPSALLEVQEGNGK